MRILFLTVHCVLSLCMTKALAQHEHVAPAGPDAYAPISVMGDHCHPRGGWMISYRYMSMWMKGNLSGSSGIDNQDIYGTYMVAPQDMQMRMHMLGVMYAPSDNLTLMLMGNLLSKSMDLRTGTGVRFKTESGGVGDLSLSGLIRIIHKSGNSLHANIGVSIPTGDISQRDDTPMVTELKLAYPMQLGSGTFDPFIGATYRIQSENISWGAQSMYQFRPGDNSQNYAMGNAFTLVGWGAISASDYLGFSGSVSFDQTGPIQGADPDMNPAVMPLFDTANSKRSQVDVGLGVDFYLSKSGPSDIRLGLEIQIPIVQHVEGIQMKNTVKADIGIQYVMGHDGHHMHQGD